MMSSVLDISVIILTYNESLHIARAIESVSGLAKRVFVIDAHSSDDTAAIAKSLGAHVYVNAWINYSRQFQWALEHCPIDTQWVLRLDADEYLEPELTAEIRAKLPLLPLTVTGVILKRKYIFLNKLIRHGDRYPLLLLRLWRVGAGGLEPRWMDEHVILSRGKSVVFEHFFVDHNLRSVSWFIDKHNKYASREMLDILGEKYGLFENKSVLPKETGQVYWRRFLKLHLYNKLPVFVRPIFYFIYRYFFRLGFLDGAVGFAYHFMQGFWYRALVDLKCLEAELVIRDAKDKSEIISRLSALTGLSLP